MIVCVGLNPAIDKLLHAPGFAVGRHVKAEISAVRPAGKAANVARVLGQLGIRCALRGFVGANEAALFQQSFAGLPVDVALDPLNDSTRVNITIVDPADGPDTHVREPGMPVTPADIEALTRRLTQDTPANGWCVFCGSLPPGCTPDRSRAICRRIQAKGARIGFDASGKHLVALREEPIALLTPNREELSELLDRPLPSHKELRHILNPSLFDSVAAQQILVSDGEEGAGLLSRETGLWARPPAVIVCNTVSAGDALLAGYLAACEQGANPSTALRRAVGTAAAAVEQPDSGAIAPDRAFTCAESCAIERLW